MLDPKLIRENPQAVKEATRVKRVASPEKVDAWLAADQRRRSAQTRADALKSEQKKVGDQVGQLKRTLKGGTTPELEKLLEQANAFKTQAQQLADEQAAAETEAASIMLQLPAIPDPTWPIGKDDADNVVARTWADPAHPPIKLEGGKKDHVTLGKELNILDFDRGVKLAGSRSYVVRGAGALLYSAVLRFAQDSLIRRGYEQMIVPVLVTEQCMVGTGYFPAGREQAYITQDNTVLVGTSEVPLASFYGNEILDLDKPIRLAALSTCFRREAGAAGKDTAGLYRVHQFDKVEQVVIHKADDAEHITLHEEIVANSEAILQALKLPYRVSKNCTGDMGQGKWRMYDIETWMPSRNGYGETHSGSALRDFQSRRLNMRYREKLEGGKTETRYCYTLNNTAIACPRVLIAIIEQYQNDDGTITVPEVLTPYMQGIEQITKTI
ncbi:MAG: serS [Phycisphaerales bacterium]|nr:serS [Phycisphaerales bacterium]